MGFVRDMANVGTFGLAGKLLSKKKKDTGIKPQPSMISNEPYERPMSFIQPRRGA